MFQIMCMLQYLNKLLYGLHLEKTCLSCSDKQSSQPAIMKSEQHLVWLVSILKLHFQALAQVVQLVVCLGLHSRVYRYDFQV